MKKLYVLAFGLIFALSCSKDRPIECAQGHCHGEIVSLHSVNSLGSFLETGESLYESPIASKADSISFDGTYGEVNNFDLVQISHTDSDLINDVPFRGRPNFRYDLHHELTKDYLIIHKVAFKRDLPSQEWSVAKERPDGRLAVPILVYNISLFNRDPIQDANYEKTTKLGEFPAKTLDEATHFRLDRTSRQLFEKVEKYDVFPVDLFEGEWFYSATVVSAGKDREFLLGASINLDASFNATSRIEFRRWPDHLIGVNTNLDESLDTEEDFNFAKVIEIPVTWLDYMVEKVGRTAHIKEVGLDGQGTVSDQSRDWEDRRFVQLDFSKIKGGYGVNEDGQVLHSKFYNLELSKDYISFVIAYPDERIRVKYAFLRAHREKEGAHLWQCR